MGIHPKFLIDIVSKMRDENGQTLVHKAALALKDPQKYFLNSLLELGFASHEADNWGRGPLSVCLKMDSASLHRIVYVFLKHGVDPGMTPTRKDGSKGCNFIRDFLLSPHGQLNDIAEMI